MNVINDAAPINPKSLSDAHKVSRLTDDILICAVSFINQLIQFNQLALVGDRELWGRKEGENTPLVFGR